MIKNKPAIGALNEAPDGSGNAAQANPKVCQLGDEECEACQRRCRIGGTIPASYVWQGW